MVSLEKATCVSTIWSINATEKKKMLALRHKILSKIVHPTPQNNKTNRTHNANKKMWTHFKANKRVQCNRDERETLMPAKGKKKTSCIQRPNEMEFKCHVENVPTGTVVSKWKPFQMLAFCDFYRAANRNVAFFFSFVDRSFLKATCNKLTFLMVNLTFGWGKMDRETNTLHSMCTRQKMKKKKHSNDQVHTNIHKTHWHRSITIMTL